MKVVLVMFRDGQMREIPLTQAKTLIGRSTDSTLRVPVADVSRQHCQVDVLASQVTVRDLGSSNGTFVNGKRVSESPLKAGDRLGIGRITFGVQIDGKPAQFKAAELAAPAPSGGKPGEDEDILDLDDVEFDVDDALEVLDDDDDDDTAPPRKPPGKK